MHGIFVICKYANIHMYFILILTMISFNIQSATTPIFRSMRFFIPANSNADEHHLVSHLQMENLNHAK